MLKKNNTFIILLLNIIIQFKYSIANKYSNIDSINNYFNYNISDSGFLRKLSNSNIVNSGKKISCKTGNETTCICPGPCMNHIPTTTQCEIKECYEWDSSLNSCKESGKSLVAAILMHIFLGIFGGGVGFMHNWFWFGIWWGILGGGLFLLCLFLCASQTENDLKPAGFSCISTIFSCGILVLWIYLMVMIANKEILDEHGCPPID